VLSWRKALTLRQKHHAAFLQSREEDSRVHQRQVALQSLDVAYNKYKEITSHLVEGHQVRESGRSPRRVLMQP
jgi:hypothetical protein